MSRGGRREGAGRRTGSRNRLVRENVGRAQASGLLPLDYMLAMMRDPSVSERRRDDMARAAAPYLHPRLTSIEHKEPSLDLTKLTHEELIFFEKTLTRISVPRDPGSA